MAFTKDIIDFSGKSDSEILDVLQKHDIPLIPNEIKMIQNEFLGRAPSLAECVLFSIEGSEHCSCLLYTSDAADE